MKFFTQKILLESTENKPDLSKLLLITLFIFLDKFISFSLFELNSKIAIGIGSRFPFVISILNSDKTFDG